MIDSSPQPNAALTAAFAKHAAPAAPVAGSTLTLEQIEAIETVIGNFNRPDYLADEYRTALNACKSLHAGLNRVAGSIADDPEFKRIGDTLLQCITNGARVTAFNDLVAIITAREKAITEAASRGSAADAKDAECWREVVRRIGYAETAYGPVWHISDLPKPTRSGNTDEQFAGFIRAAIDQSGPAAPSGVEVGGA